ncbi:alpha/beta fold hydrolase [Paraburkholderia terrae]|uniref:alpha/beta fold hydrolase n=1 Tax=Paraburkholderia TaxID=1822464 RepID=UPI00207F4CC1|nr:alpha/beta fold hydrolase [Paraburkholderia terrae]BEU21198.1 alpha/beta fold hydrolase [Paraburkholderia sp. 22B1P]GJH06761.1 alpha/beta fold hydrolase [Paraburkholderia terrae]
MSTFVLVHGSWHGAWCWERLVPMLEVNGHHVCAVDLPGMGRDRTDPNEVSFALCVQKIVDALTAANGPVILVGHSLAGVLITQVAEICPERVAALVYLAAFVPSDGESCAQLSGDDHGTLPFGMRISPDGMTALVLDPWIVPSFYNDCSEVDTIDAVRRIKQQPMAPLLQPVAISDARSGSVPSVYIECLRDHAITPGFQRQMQAARSFEFVLSLDTGHSPFISAPSDLAKHLLTVSQFAERWSNARLSAPSGSSV